jgi:multiple sugar transport system ATP-binding protein
VLGLRPEALRFSTAPDAIPVTVEAETPLNEKTVSLAVTKNGREILISRPAGTLAPASGEAGIEVDPQHAVLFARDTGQRIAPSQGDQSDEAAA